MRGAARVHNSRQSAAAACGNPGGSHLGFALDFRAQECGEIGLGETT